MPALAALATDPVQEVGTVRRGIAQLGAFRVRVRVRVRARGRGRVRVSIRIGFSRRLRVSGRAVPPCTESTG